LLTTVGIDGFECHSADVTTIRRRFFDWLERRSSAPLVREELLDVVTSVVEELVEPSPIRFTVIAEDGGGNVLLRFLVHESRADLPARLGRALAAVDRMADRWSVDLVPGAGDGYLLVDVTLPG
jgi:hypothetical protein